MAFLRTGSASADLQHWVSQRPLKGPYPDSMKIIDVGMGCFWGAERCFWTLDGVYVTSVGYAGGSMQDPDYRSVCSGTTGHAEMVRVVYDPAQVSLSSLLQVFWQSHDPTQGDRQGNDRGSQYRSIIIMHEAADEALVLASRDAYQAELNKRGYGAITTEIRKAAGAPYYLAEDYHQQYLAKNPNGYCGLGGTGVSCPLPDVEPEV